MLTTNPFADLAASVSPGVMQTFVVFMILFVVAGTLFDVMHKQSAKYFLALSRETEERGTRQVGVGEKMSLAVKTATMDVLTSAEFCNPKRRIAHLLGMYGFVISAIGISRISRFWRRIRYSNRSSGPSNASRKISSASGGIYRSLGNCV